MQLRAEQLSAHLAKGLARVYAIHGDEPLLALEAADAVRAAARKRGFSEREVFDVARGFDWSEFKHSAAAQSLFASQKIIELRLPSGKPGTDGAAALAAYCAHPAEENVLLVTLPRVDRQTQGGAWFSALGAAGAVVDVFPVDRSRLPAWIGERLARQKQSAPREVLAFLADRVEGNLLAAQQEVSKLALLAPAGELSLEQVRDAVADVARYDPSAAAEALVRGELARYARVLEGLRGEGEAPNLVVAVLGSLLFVLRGLAAGEALDALLRSHRVWNIGVRRALESAGNRYKADRLERAIQRCAAADRAVKGVGSGEPWEELQRLGLELVHGSKG